MNNQYVASGHVLPHRNPANFGLAVFVIWNRQGKRILKNLGCPFKVHTVLVLVRARFGWVPLKFMDKRSHAPDSFSPSVSLGSSYDSAQLSARCGFGRMGLIKTESSIWKLGAMVGTALTAIGLGAGYFDEATHFRFALLSDHFGIFLIALLLGMLSSFVFIIGWARQFEKTTQARAARIVFISPWVAGLLTYPIEGLNVHGPSALLWFLVMPAASLLAFVLHVMAD
jgi:hypothetical protein